MVLPHPFRDVGLEPQPSVRLAGCRIGRAVGRIGREDSPAVVEADTRRFVIVDRPCQALEVEVANLFSTEIHVRPSDDVRAHFRCELFGKPLGTEPLLASLVRIELGAVAKDVVQDTFIKLYEQDPEKVKGSLKAWLFTVCRNRCFDIIRKEKRMINVEDDQLTVIRDAGDDPSRAAERADEHSNVIKFLDRLPENQREVIRLKFEGDMSYKEISQVTQLSVSNVGFLIHAGIKRLRGLLSDQVA